MSKINQIQAAILSLDPGAYQKLMDSYVMKSMVFPILCLLDHILEPIK